MEEVKDLEQMDATAAMYVEDYHWGELDRERKPAEEVDEDGEIDKDEDEDHAVVPIKSGLRLRLQAFAFAKFSG